MSARVGMGVVVAKLPSGEWSPPASIGIGGLGGGFNAGAEMVDFLVVLNSRAAVRSFMTAGSLQLGGNLSLAVGPLGRTGEASAAMNADMQFSAMYSYSVSRGLYGGITIEGTVLIERKDTNEKVYGGSVTPMQILSGQVEMPQFAIPLITRIEEATGKVPFADEDSSVIGNEDYNDLGYDAHFDDLYAPPQSIRRRTAPNAPSPVSYRQRLSGSPMDDLDEQLQSASLSGRSPSPPPSSRWRPPSVHHRSDPCTARGPSTYDAPTFSTSSKYRVDSFGRGSSSHSRTRTQDSLAHAAENPFSDMNAVLDDDIPHTQRYSQLHFQSHSIELPSDNYALLDVDSTQMPTPASCLRDPDPVQTHPIDLVDPSLLDGDLVVATHDYKAQRDSDLSFQRGDLIRVTRRTDKLDDWWMGELVANYREGPPESGEYVHFNIASMTNIQTGSHQTTLSHSRY